MATGGDDSTPIVDQDHQEVEDRNQGVGKRRRNPPGILRIDTSGDNGSQRASRRKSSTGSVVDYRFAAAASLNPQVGVVYFPITIVCPIEIIQVGNRLMTAARRM